MNNKHYSRKLQIGDQLCSHNCSLLETKTVTASLDTKEFPNLETAKQRDE